MTTKRARGTTSNKTVATQIDHATGPPTPRRRPRRSARSSKPSAIRASSSSNSPTGSPDRFAWGPGHTDVHFSSGRKASLPNDSERNQAHDRQEADSTTCRTISSGPPMQTEGADLQPPRRAQAEPGRGQHASRPRRAHPGHPPTPTVLRTDSWHQRRDCRRRGLGPRDAGEARPARLGPGSREARVDRRIARHR